ncbi:MAG: response regulator [Bacteroidia bacterium]
MRIFLVEDNPGDVVLTREALKEIIGREFQMDVATDGALAISMVDEMETGIVSVPDLFFIDLNLPKVHGKLVLEHIRRIHTTKNIPAIVISTSNRAEDRRIVEENKPGFYAMKPMNYNDFVLVLRKAIETLNIDNKNSLPV